MGILDYYMSMERERIGIIVGLAMFLWTWGWYWTGTYIIRTRGLKRLTKLQEFIIDAVWAIVVIAFVTCVAIIKFKIAQ